VWRAISRSSSVGIAQTETGESSALTRETLTRLCAIPINGVLDAQWDGGSMAMEAKILRPLLWFGLFGYRHDAPPGDRYGGRHVYRKSALFDRFLQFDVEIERASSTLN
jgi:hypothetical protein